MAETSPHEVTRLLKAWSGGDGEALARLAPVVEAELHRLARHYMRGERVNHTLQPTALVNEAFVRLIDWKNVNWQNRAHFFGVSAQIMRRILVDFARRRPHQKKLGDVRHVTLDDAPDIALDRSDDLVALDDALQALEKLDPRKSRIVELRYFAGLSVEETAEVIGVAPITVMREWSKARAWLYKELTANPG
jgi:RNA polymerase sigma factor (TIGR02999 family)